MSRESSVCPHCGRSNASDVAPLGLCPACLLATTRSVLEHACPYDVVAPLGQDSRGVTYLAQTLVLPSRYVALTIMEKHQEASSIVARFRALRPALARLAHPRAGKVIDAGVTEDGSAYVASDHVTGMPLSTLLMKRSLSASDREHIAAQLTDVMTAAHGADVVHLDLEPSKVKISRVDGIRAAVVGFGMRVIADGASDGPDADLTALGTLIGQLSK